MLETIAIIPSLAMTRGLADLLRRIPANTVDITVSSSTTKHISNTAWNISMQINMHISMHTAIPR